MTRDEAHRALAKDWVGASTFAEATGIPHRTIKRWCLLGRIHAGRRGPKLWFVNMRKLRESRDSEIGGYLCEIISHALYGDVIEEADLAESA